MFAGHVGAAMVIARVERRVNVGWFMLAALLLDLLLWLFVLAGWESLTIPANFADTHQPAFEFHLSHGLLASLAWSALAAAVLFLACPGLGASRPQAAALIAAAVFSHWLLDWLVHVPEMPLAGAGSAKLGLGLWRNMPLALLVEALVVLAGLWLFLPGAGLSRRRKIGLALLSLFVLVFTVLGMTIAPAPPSAMAMAASSALSILLVCALGCWLGRESRA
jgi:hypothetical protein